MQRATRSLLANLLIGLNRQYIIRQHRGIRLPAHVAATLDKEISARPLDQSDVVAVSHCGGFILCWHPKKRQSYDSTLPMPTADTNAEPGEPVYTEPLKPGLVQLADNRERFGPSRDDLSNVFHKPVAFFRPFPQKAKRARPYEYADDEAERTPRRGL